jgi:hypothetical protein
MTLNKISTCLCVVSALIGVGSAIYNWGYSFGKADQVVSGFETELKKLAIFCETNAQNINVLSSQIAYIRGQLDTQSKNSNYIPSKAIQESAKNKLSPQEYNFIFSTIDKMPLPEARIFLKTRAGFSDQQIKSMLKN